MLFVWKHTWRAAQFGNDLSYRRSTAVSNSARSSCNEPTVYGAGLDAYCLWHFKYHYIEVYTRKSKFKTGILAVTAGPFVYVMGRKGRLLKSLCLASGFCLGGEQENAVPFGLSSCTEQRQLIRPSCEDLCQAPSCILLFPHTWQSHAWNTVAHLNDGKASVAS